MSCRPDSPAAAPPGDARALPPAGGVERWSWALFDFANSAFNTLVITFVYAAFFTRSLCGDDPAVEGATRGAELWSGSQTISALACALLAPVVGALVDRRRGRKRSALIGLSLFTIACTAALVWPAKDPATGVASETAIWTALVLVTVANTAFELMFVLYNAFLPGLGDADTVGRLSGRGWALGYAGGLIALVIALGFIGELSASHEPWLPAENGFNVRATNLLVAGWFLVFGLPMFLLVRDRGGAVGGPGARAGEAGGFDVRASVREVVRTLGNLRSYPDLLRLLLARLFYNDAVIAVTGLSAIYMTGRLGMALGETILAGIWLNVVAAISAFACGWLDDRVGAKPTILWSVGFVLAGVALAIAVPTSTAFWYAATVAGIGLGPCQSASRSMLSRFISPQRAGEFYGLYALTGKATTWLGPLLFHVVTSATHSQRLGLAPLIGMLLLGLLLAFGIDERRGIARAAADG
ncbi:MAG: MFS transporter [Planctomycetes bacterium]|nr:MFS transporter [Planctomycetota bacterium]